MPSAPTSTFSSASRRRSCRSRRGPSPPSPGRGRRRGKPPPAPALSGTTAVMSSPTMTSYKTAAKSRFALPRARSRRPRSSASRRTMDLAVLRIKTAVSCPTVVLGSSNELKVGQSAFAIGTPFGLDQSLTSGISARSNAGCRPAAAANRQRDPDRHRDQSRQFGRAAPGFCGTVDWRQYGDHLAFGLQRRHWLRHPRRYRQSRRPELIKNGRVPTPGIGIVAASEAVATRLGVEGVIVVRTAPEVRPSVPASVEPISAPVRSAT